MTKSVLEHVADELRAGREELAESLDVPLHCEQLDASELIDKAADAIAATPDIDLLIQAVSALYNIIHDHPEMCSPDARRAVRNLLDELECTDAPEPGGAWSQERGCTCHAPAVGMQDISPPEVRRDKWCPLHGRDPDAERERQIERKMNRSNEQ